MENIAKAHSAWQIARVRYGYDVNNLTISLSAIHRHTCAFSAFRLTREYLNKISHSKVYLVLFI